MRLSRIQAQQATDELLGMLSENRPGLPTSDMSGTPKFHGEKTLSGKQIASLLRATGKVRELNGGAGMRTFTIWKLI